MRQLVNLNSPAWKIAKHIVFFFLILTVQSQHKFIIKTDPYWWKITKNRWVIFLLLIKLFACLKVPNERKECKINSNLSEDPWKFVPSFFASPCHWQACMLSLSGEVVYSTEALRQVYEVVLTWERIHTTTLHWSSAFLQLSMPSIILHGNANLAPPKASSYLYLLP